MNRLDELYLAYGKALYDYNITSKHVEQLEAIMTELQHSITEQIKEDDKNNNLHDSSGSDRINRRDDA